MNNTTHNNHMAFHPTMPEVNGPAEKKLLTFYLLSVRGTSVMCVDLFTRRALIEAHKAVQQVITSCIVIIAARFQKSTTPKLRKRRIDHLPGVVWEIVAHR